MARGALSAVIREETGKGAARRLRREAKIPGVLYGHQVDAKKVALDRREVERFIQQWGTGRLVDLTVDGKKEVVLVREVQYDPVRRDVLHVDLLAIALDEEINTMVPLVVYGEEDRTADGGVVTQLLRELEVRCLPTAIPERVELDVSNMELGDTLTLADITFPESVVPVLEEDEVVVTVSIPRAVVEEDAAEDQEDVDGDTEDAEGDDEEASSDADDA